MFEVNNRARKIDDLKDKPNVVKGFWKLDNEFELVARARVR